MNAKPSQHALPIQENAKTFTTACIFAMTTSFQIPLFKVFMPDGIGESLAPVLHSGRLASGPQVAQFELEAARWLGVERAAALCDSSAALTLALYMSGVRPGDEVITSPLACAATLMPIANLFARPAWCDIDPATGMPTAAMIAKCITEKTRAILFYHWSGDVGETAEIAALARRHNIKLIEDASEAFGAMTDGCRLGGIADYTIYSFYATKHINCGGDGAILLAKDPDTIEIARNLRRFGIDPKGFRLQNGDLNPDFNIPVAGFNFAMNEIEAAIGRANLGQADNVVARQQANGAFLDTALAHITGVKLLNRRPGSRSAYWTYSLRVQRRDELIRKLTEHGIGAQRLHVRNDSYSCFPVTKAELPGVAVFDAENLSIPCGWWVTETQRTEIVRRIQDGW